MTLRVLALISGLTLAWPAATGAHHSTAMFDLGKRVTLTGTLKELQWTNPHAWIQMTTREADGSEVEWSIECGSPNSLSRQGWKVSLFKAGEKISVVGSPMKDGTHAAMLLSVTLAGGVVLGNSAVAAQPPK